ncbi:uncharacterized protein A4U43_C04F22510 [Asparagus officinalis]|uniref:MINDY deubiquitinase domain-containing protein n=1 Tax=Asparagus officinalis TaxID=4686 RepID=A0A5P1F5N5_ASPOF|nr:uncharacterized protein A4U43_C04F22510 [Asparagus officinalis]
MAEIDNGVIYKTKFINFFSRSILIVLENETSTSLLVSICNVLLLRGDARLDLNWTQVPQQDLMSLTVDSLLNSENQEKIGEAISLLPNLLSD